jgi:hypothetical protein
MKFDLRIPIGILFSLYGVILSLFGALSDPALNQRSLGMNVNLTWGLVLLVFGVAMLLLSRGKRDKQP